MGMSTGDKKRLGAYIASRRRDRGYRTARAFAEQLTISERAYYDIEKGLRVPQRGNAAEIERLLGWGPGSIDAVLEGGEPIDMSGGPHPPEGAEHPVTVEQLLQQMVDDAVRRITGGPKPPPDSYPPGYPEYKPPSVDNEAQRRARGS